MTDLDRALDEDLSALLDGELSPEREAELRRRAATDESVAARLAELEAVGTEIRELPAPAVPAGLQPEIRRRIALEPPPAESGPDNVRPLRAWRRRGSWIGVAAAMAASLVLYLTTSTGPGLDPGAGVLETATDEEIGIALEFETLASGADLEVIEELEVLELLAERG